jgi:hypothetical protein
VTAPGEQPNAIALPLDDEPEAVVLDCETSRGAGGHSGAPCWDAGLILRLAQHAVEIIHTTGNGSPKGWQRGARSVALPVP